MCQPNSLKKINFEEIKMFCQLWEELSSSKIGQQLWHRALEEFESAGLRASFYANDSDVKILQANRSFLRSIESIYQTTLRYVDTSEENSLKPAHLPTYEPYARQTPAPSTTQARRPEKKQTNLKEEDEEYDIMDDTDLEDCTRGISRMKCQE
ncbi:hypothetical protein D6C86_08177 [Aureobasidium pullulans]|nr:hypothetical protein D6C87_04418 [Aureobasidium pullulans]THZ56027.1 hypothetical protein D6C86_08177 [Aureobasidium pullulans]THZ69107.1 hypothetical protein D6C88_07884 [Aureobasidium pullulans]